MIVNGTAISTLTIVMTIATYHLTILVTVGEPRPRYRPNLSDRRLSAPETFRARAATEGLDRSTSRAAGSVRDLELVQSDPLLLLGPRIRQRFGDGGDDARRNEGEGSQQTNVTFALAFPLGDLGQAGNSAEPNVLDPCPGLADCREHSISALGLDRRFRAARVNDTLHGSKAARPPRECGYTAALTRPGAVDAGPLYFGGEVVCDGKMEFQRLSLHDHALEMALDQIAIANGGGVLCFTHRCEVLAQAVEHQLLDVGGRHAGDAACLRLSLLQDCVRHVIAVAQADLVGVRRAHAIAAVVEDAAGEDGGRALEPKLPCDGSGGKLGLYGCEQVTVEDRLVLAAMHLAPIDHLADVEPVLEQVREGADAEADTAPLAPVGKAVCLGPDAALIEDLDRAERKIAREDRADGVRLRGHEDDLLVEAAIAERKRPTDPNAPALGGGDLVTRPLADHLALELGEREQHIEREPAHAARGVE